MNYAIVALALVALIFLIVKTFLFQTEETAVKVVIGIFLSLVAIIIIISVFKNLSSLKIHAILLDYASKMIK